MMKVFLLFALTTLITLSSMMSYNTRKEKLNFGVVSYVVANFPLIHTEEDALAYMLENVENFEHFVAEASQKNVDLLVFPEYSITSPAILSVPLHVADLLMLDFVWDKDNNPVFDNKNTVINRLASAARMHELYLVVDLAARDSVNNRRYNMALAFDRQGNIVASYRKRKLYFEEQIMDEPIPFENEGKFETDSNETVQLLICFDILYTNQIDQDVNIVAYPTAWPYEAPFLSAIQAHSGWARARNASVLAANLQSALKGQVGSGVYGPDRIRAFTMEDADDSVLIVDNENISNNKNNKNNNNNDNKNKEKREHMARFRVMHEDLSQYNWQILEPNQNESVQLDHCTLNYSAISNNLDKIDSESVYALVSRRGNRTFGQGHYKAFIQSCGLLYCKKEFVPSKCEAGDSMDSWIFGNVDLKMEIEDEFKAMPVTMRTDLITPIVDFEFDVVDDAVNVHVDQVGNDLYVVGLYAVLHECQ